MSDAHSRETGTDDISWQAFPNGSRAELVRAFGVEYAHVQPPEGGDLYVTRHGWPHLAHLFPAQWHAESRYSRQGKRLSGSTGHVYHLPSSLPGAGHIGLVIKFSRVAQDVPLVVATTLPDNVSPDVIAEARFNSPMEEFGLLMELREAARRNTRRTVHTQRPLAIYAPPEEFQLWQLGRDKSRFRSHSRVLAEDQETELKAIELDIKRVYVLLYQWIRGKDAQDAVEAGLITEEEFKSLYPRVTRQLSASGFRVLDNKPRHYILRPLPRGGVLRDRRGQIVYGLVDFELLQRTPESQQAFKSRRQERYWQPRDALPPVGETPSHLKAVTLFGVDYLFGTAPDGGLVWVVGQDPELFDYFLPERWRRTPRVKLSAGSEVYRTRTRDNIAVVYRRSRVGARPAVDPLHPQGRRIRECGYNSPFEEVSIAQSLRRMGISTTVPRAILRTGHPSVRAPQLRDDTRFHDHVALTRPDRDGAPMLEPGYDYYTLWDDLTQSGAPGSMGDQGTRTTDLETAHARGFVTGDEYEQVVREASQAFAALGLAEGTLNGQDLVVSLASDRTLRRDPHGGVSTWFIIDALSAYDFGLLDEEGYRQLVADAQSRLQAVDCEAPNLSGRHLLLSLNPQGEFSPDRTGRIAFTLCNFEMIRGLYRPIR